MTAAIINADCLDALRAMPDNSVDAIVTDPPYGLSNIKPERITEAIVAWASGDRERVPDGSGFMGKAWDCFVPPPAAWDECLRVLKPGGHLVAFAGSRTHDLMGLSIRMAWFEIRDGLAWLYGSGFPKSMNVGKAIASGGRPEDIRRLAMGDDYQPSGRGRVNYDHGAGSAMNGKSTPAGTDWDGWGTALKPAFEPVTLARKPLEGTVAANVLKWGTGALNIDATRIEHDAKSAAWVEKWSGNEGHPGGMFGGIGTRFGGSPSGRWPANVALDEHQAAALDEQSGVSKSRQHTGRRSGKADETSLGKFAGQELATMGHDDEGGASRFFYCAKASSKERPEVDGVKHPTVKPLSLMRWLVRLVTPPGGLVLDPFAGSGTTLEAAALEGFSCTGIELDPNYAELCRVRIKRADEAERDLFGEAS